MIAADTQKQLSIIMNHRVLKRR